MGDQETNFYKEIEEKTIAHSERKLRVNIFLLEEKFQLAK